MGLDLSFLPSFLSEVSFPQGLLFVDVLVAVNNNPSHNTFALSYVVLEQCLITKTLLLVILGTPVGRILLGGGGLLVPLLPGIEEANGEKSSSENDAGREQLLSF